MLSQARCTELYPIPAVQPIQPHAMTSVKGVMIQRRLLINILSTFLKLLSIRLNMLAICPFFFFAFLLLFLASWLIYNLRGKFLYYICTTEAE